MQDALDNLDNGRLNEDNDLATNPIHVKLAGELPTKEDIENAMDQSRMNIKVY